MKSFLKIGLYLFIFVFTLSLIPSCVSIKPYQRIYLNDVEMAMGHSKSESFELNALNYREGSLNIIMGKTSGGCGCN